MATNDSNNDLLSDLADEVRGYNKTNNQLLKLLVNNGGTGGGIIKQPAIQELDPDDTAEMHIIDKINEIIRSDKNAGVTE